MVETTGRNMFGEPYCIREAVLTPEQDTRGLLHEQDLTAGKDKGFLSYAKADGEEQARICKMYQDGIPMQNIATRLGRAPKTVRKILIKNGLRKPHDGINVWTDEERRTLVQMYFKGESYAAIGKAVGRTSRAVAKEARRLRKQQAI